MEEKKNRRAIVLIMVLCVLAILLVLAVTFVLLCQMERVAARNFVNQVRAKLCAQSGIHFAMVETRALLSEHGFELEDSIYHGEDLNGDGEVSDEEDKLYGRPDNIPQISDCPLKRALRPSFMLDRKPPNGEFTTDDLITIRTKSGTVRKVGVSSFLGGGTHKYHGDYYAVKVQDLSGRIHINMDDHPHLNSILINLIEALNTEHNWKMSSERCEQIGQALFDKRPYVALEEIRTKLRDAQINLTGNQWEQLQACLTVYAWRDKSVIKPPTDIEDDGTPVLVDRIENPDGITAEERDGKIYADREIYKWETIRPVKIDYPRDKNGNIVGRAPVNINTAPKSLLVALIRDLAGFWLDETAGNVFPCDDNMHFLQDKGFGYKYSYTYNLGSGSLGKLTSTGIDSDMASQIAEAIITNREMEPTEAEKEDYPWRGPFRSWQQFNTFCDKVLSKLSEPADPEPDFPAELKYFLTPQQADLLKANFNPNSNLAEFNPPYQRHFRVSKTNLTYYTTEFSFFPTGYFSISSLGRILGPDDKILAEAEIETIVQLFEIYKESTQKEFLYEYWHDSVRIKNNIINGSPGPQTTAGGLTLQTYPEITLGKYSSLNPDLDKKLYVEFAGYDGYITLATVENQSPDFQANYNEVTEFDANPGEYMEEPKDVDQEGPYANTLVCPEGADHADKAEWLINKPGKLFPDGVYSEKDSTPIYDYKPPNLNQFTVSLWIKPHFLPEYSSKLRTYFTYQLHKDQVAEWFYTRLGTNRPCAPFGIYSFPNTSELHSTDIEEQGFHDWAKDVAGWPVLPPVEEGYYHQIEGLDNAAFIVWGFGAEPGKPSIVDGGNPQWSGGMITPCLNHLDCGLLMGHDEPLPHDCITRCGQDWGTLFRAGKWLHLAWIHDAHPQKTSLRCRTDAFKLIEMLTFPSWAAEPVDIIYVNGIECAGVFDLWDLDLPALSPPDKSADFYSNNFLRLGERVSQEYLNSAADSTMDEVTIWANLPSPSITGTGITTTNLTLGDAINTVRDVWQEGRYYSGINDTVAKIDDRGHFTSRAIDLAGAAGITGMPVTVFMIAWTQYIPEAGLYSKTPNSTERSLKEQGATCGIEILDENYDPADPQPIGIRKTHPAELPDPGGELIKDADTGDRLMVMGKDRIRYRVYFDPGDIDPLNDDLIIDPLIFDDITIIYYSVPKFLLWCYRR